MAAWLFATGLAVGLGFLAVSLVSASPSSAALQATATTSDHPSGDDTTTSSPAGPTSSGGGTVRQVTVGGTVLATCAGTVPRLAGAPATGWRIDDSAQAGRVEFRSGTQSVEVRADCSTGSPVLAVDGPRSDGRGSDDGTAGNTAGTTTAATTASATRTTDDHGSGGHGGDG
jgi:hypothetical protein